MKSLIAERLSIRNNPVATIWTDTKPENAIQYSPGQQGCCMALFAKAVKDGDVVVFDRQTCGCHIGTACLGFGKLLETYQFDKNCFYYSYSVGNEKWEVGRETVEKLEKEIPPQFKDVFIHGMRMKKNVEDARIFFEEMTYVTIKEKYVVMKPLDMVDLEKELVEVITFVVTPHQFSALVLFSNYSNSRMDNVIIPPTSGCGSVSLFPYIENNKMFPRAVAGMVDLTTRSIVRNQLGDNCLTFSLPVSKYLEMEKDAEGSLLDIDWHLEYN